MGAPIAGKRVLVVDDVITAGTAIRESVELLRVEGATLAGVVVALDRQEWAVSREDGSAIQVSKITQFFGNNFVLKLEMLLVCGERARCSCRFNRSP